MRKLAILAAAVLAIGACSQKGARAPCPQGKVCLEAGNSSDPVSLDPHKMQGVWESRIATDVFEGLTTTDNRGDIIPGMATHWETSADGLVWTFHLRDAKWSDGVAVTAGDFEFSLRRILDPALAAEYASLLYFIKNAQAVNEGKLPLTALGVRALDRRTLQITLEHPAPYILELGAHATMQPVPRHVVEKFGDDNWFKPAHIVSNGPYKIVSWKLGDRIVAVKNPYFRDSANICIDQVSYYPTDDPAAPERQVAAGDLDMHTPVRANRIPYLRDPKRMPKYVHVNPELGTTYFAFNTRLKKFQDVRVRKALSLAVDRDFLVNGPYKGSGRPVAYTFVPPGIANYTPPPNPDWASWPLEKRQAEARRLLAEAGYGPKNPLQVTLNHRGTDVLAAYVSLQNDWRLVGVKVTLQGAETVVAYDSYRTRDFEIADAGWVADYNDPMNFLYLMQSSTGAMNYGDYNNPAYDALLLKADNEPDAVKRAAYLREAEVMMLESYSVVPTMYEVNSSLVSPRITGFVDNVTDEHPTRFLCFKDAKKAASKT